MSALDTQPFPRGALIAASAMIGLSLIATTAVRLSRVLTPEAQPAAAAAPVAVASSDLRFDDQADGSIRITHAVDDSLAATVRPGEGGFIRGVMRGLARERRSRGIGDQPPFNLTLWRDGELSLSDSVTGRQIELTAFGSTNRAAFAALLPGRMPKTVPVT